MDAATVPLPTAVPTALAARLLRHRQPHRDAPPLTQAPGSPITPPVVNRWHQAVSPAPDREGDRIPDWYQTHEAASPARFSAAPTRRGWFQPQHRGTGRR